MSSVLSCASDILDDLIKAHISLFRAVVKALVVEPVTTILSRLWNSLFMTDRCASPVPRREAMPWNKQHAYGEIPSYRTTELIVCAKTTQSAFSSDNAMDRPKFSFWHGDCVRARLTIDTFLACANEASVEAERQVGLR